MKRAFDLKIVHTTSRIIHWLLLQLSWILTTIVRLFRSRKKRKKIKKNPNVTAHHRSLVATAAAAVGHQRQLLELRKSHTQPSQKQKQQQQQQQTGNMIMKGTILFVDTQTKTCVLDNDDEMSSASSSDDDEYYYPAPTDDWKTSCQAVLERLRAYRHLLPTQCTCQQDWQQLSAQLTRLEEEWVYTATGENVWEQLYRQQALAAAQDAWRLAAATHGYTATTTAAGRSIDLTVQTLWTQCEQLLARQEEIRQAAAVVAYHASTLCQQEQQQQQQKQQGLLLQIQEQLQSHILQQQQQASPDSSSLAPSPLLRFRRRRRQRQQR